MNIVVMSAMLDQCLPIVSHLIERIQREHSIRKVIRMEVVPVRKSWRRIFRVTPSKLAYLFERKFFYPGWYRRRDEKIQRCLYGDRPLPTFTDVLAIPSTSLNDASTAELLRVLETDVLIVCGLPILRPEIFSVPKLTTINVHLGLAPNYRGEHTVFWPLYKRDYEHIGVTVHRIDTGIDTGPILAHGIPAVVPDDDEASLMAKMAICAGDVVAAFLYRPTATTLPQGELGPTSPLCLFRKRRIWHDLGLAIRRRIFGERCPTLPDRSVNYFTAEPHPRAAKRDQASQRSEISTPAAS